MENHAQPSAIRFERIGPIEGVLELDASQPGLVDLTGRCGSGKTHALEAVKALLGHATRWSPRPTWGHPKGSVEGFGGKVTFTSRTAGAGSAEGPRLAVEELAAFITGAGHKTAEARNKARVEALFGMYPIEATPAHVATLLGGKTELLAAVTERMPQGLKAEALSGNPAEVADRLRAHLHERRRELERSADQADGSVSALQVEIDALAGELEAFDPEGLSVDAEAVTLRTRERALEYSAGRRAARVEAERAQAEARRALEEEFESEAAVEAAAQEAVDFYEGRAEEVASLEAREATLLTDLEGVRVKLGMARGNRSVAETKRDGATQTRDRYHRLVTTLEQDLSAIGPSEEDLDAEREELAAARRRLEQLQAWEHREQLLAKRRSAEAFRDGSRAAATTVRTVTDQIPDALATILSASGLPHLTVQDGLLYLRSDEEGAAALEFDVPNVSAGEIVDVALDIFLLGVPPATGGVPRAFVLDAEARMFLDETFADHLDSGCQVRDLLCLSERTTRGPLRWERWQDRDAAGEILEDEAVEDGEEVTRA